MKQLIVDYIPFEVSPEQINESMKSNNGKLIVRGVLQSICRNFKNQNGRIQEKFYNVNLKSMMKTLFVKKAF